MQLGVFVDEAISYIDNHGIPFDAVAVSQGPGSYTGLRIGVSMAKGICYARGLKLIAVPTLELLCVPVLLYQEDLPEDALLCPMIDARRMEVYAALYDRALRPVRAIGADIVDESTYQDFLNERSVYFWATEQRNARLELRTRMRISFRMSCLWHGTWGLWRRRLLRWADLKTWLISSLSI